MRYDLIIQHGRVVDPAANVDGVLDVGVVGTTIAAVAPNLNATDAAARIDAGGLIVAPGLIDFHAHTFLGALGLGRDIDPVCRSTGVTTLVDAGSTGAANFPLLKELLIDQVNTRIYAFLHVSTIGQADLHVGESTYLDHHNPQAAAAMAGEHPDRIVGIKVRQQRDAVGRNGLRPLELAKQAAELAGGLPVMVHVTDPPEALGRILDRLGPGDVVTHFLHGRGMGILDDRGRVDPAVWEARRRGVVFDLGHGRNHLSFPVARAALQEGFTPDTISSDLHRGALAGTVRNLPHVLSKFLNLGMDLLPVLAAATATPARLLKAEGRLGTLQPGSLADIALLELESGTFSFEDTEGNLLEGHCRLTPRCTVQNGAVVWQSGSPS
jgi:dihydroorotase